MSKEIKGLHVFDVRCTVVISSWENKPDSITTASLSFKSQVGEIIPIGKIDDTTEQGKKAIQELYNRRYVGGQY